MHFDFRAFAVTACLLLTGCATDKYVVVTKPIFPPDQFLQDCPVEKPPSEESWKLAGENATREQAADKRESMLMDFGNKQTKNVGSCNADKQGLREWKQKQQKIYEKDLKDAEAKSQKKD